MHRTILWISSILFLFVAQKINSLTSCDHHNHYLVQMIWFRWQEVTFCWKLLKSHWYCGAAYPPCLNTGGLEHISGPQYQYPANSHQHHWYHQPLPLYITTTKHQHRPSKFSAIIERFDIENSHLNTQRDLSASSSASTPCIKWSKDNLRS